MNDDGVPSVSPKIDKVCELMKTMKTVGPFDERVKLFKAAVERAAKKYKVTLYTGYLDSCHDEHLIIGDTLNTENEVYFDTLTKEEAC